MLDSSHIGKIVSFTLYPAGILPSLYQQVKVIGIYNPRTALRLQDVASLHVNVFPTLPVGSPAKYTDYNYVEVEFPDGATHILGLPWIVESSIVVHQNVQVKVIVSEVNASDVQAIRESLVANGFNHLEISLL